MAWSHNNKNLILTGIYHRLTKEQILNKILSIVKPSKVSKCLFLRPSKPVKSLSSQIDIRLGQEDRLAILSFVTHREAAMARRSLILHVGEFGQMSRLRWLKPNSYFN